MFFKTLRRLSGSAEEWDYVDVLPEQENPRPNIAGKYGPASNVFAIGMCLHDMITHHVPPYPPGAVGPLNHPNLADGVGYYFTQDTPFVTDAWQQRVAPFYTHGARLLSENINIVLKSIIVRCLADQPAHRPTLAELLRFVDRFERLPQMGQPDDWFRDVYATPRDRRMLEASGVLSTQLLKILSALVTSFSLQTGCQDKLAGPSA
ncbi:hypothetical protein Daus18300_012091 [Diaporthe australafricana]|uniref:Protein kinase domain-containing protein n=1 Tax=Diaporthe australafricana TaxID=127596 RepID=A0ABR3W409_9PEZI